jgi:hypothetical protein
MNVLISNVYLTKNIQVCVRVPNMQIYSKVSGKNNIVSQYNLYLSFLCIICFVTLPYPLHCTCIYMTKTNLFFQRCQPLKCIITTTFILGAKTLRKNKSPAFFSWNEVSSNNHTRFIHPWNDAMTMCPRPRCPKIWTMCSLDKVFLTSPDPMYPYPGPYTGGGG